MKRLIISVMVVTLVIMIAPTANAGLYLVANNCDFKITSDDLRVVVTITDDNILTETFSVQKYQMTIISDHGDNYTVAVHKKGAIWDKTMFRNKTLYTISDKQLAIVKKQMTVVNEE
ncbi:hypothetical protein HQ550_03040 [bacterium]|nr:hypothetical protein [bacterium]